MSFADHWQAIRHNRAFWILMLGISFGAVSSTAMGKSVLYVFKYIVGDAAGARYALSLVAASGVIIIPGWVFATRLLGKQLAWLTAAGIGLAGVVGLAVLPIHGAVQMTLFFIYMHVAALGISMTYWSMMPDTVEYGEWRSGRRPESFIFGLGMFFQKVALGVAAGLFGWSLDLIGYHANQIQTPATLTGLRMIIVVLPALGLAGSAIVMLFYPLKRGAHEKIVAELEATRPGLQGAAITP
jgi:GPH family glycoside/pentoside/hexuronide:cation symporter